MADAIDPKVFFEQALKDIAWMRIETWVSRKELFGLQKEFDDLVKTGHVSELTQALQAERFRRALERIDDCLAKLRRQKEIILDELKKLA